MVTILRLIADENWPRLLLASSLTPFPASPHTSEESTMTVATVTHLNSRGDARPALEFYRSVFGGELAMITYQDAHNVQSPAEADQLMWGQVAADNGFRIMAYDVPSTQP